MRNKRYPLYSQWCELFGMDRARGDKAEDCVAADHTQLDEESDDIVPENSSAKLPNVNVGESPSSHSNASSSSKQKRGKRKAMHTDTEQIVNLMGKFCETTNERLGEMSQNIGYEIKMSKKRETIREELGKVVGLDAETRIAVAKILVSNDKDLELFFSLPPDEKPLMVKMVMQGRL